MGSNPTYRLAPAAIDADNETLLALRDLRDYTPVNRSHSAEALSALKQIMEQTAEDELRAQKGLAAARDIAISAAWDYHKAMQGAKAQVVAQYGDDSLAVQAIGLKKTSDRKRATRRRSTQPVV